MPTKPEKGKVDHILVQRFVRLYSWWFDESLYRKVKLRDLLKHPPRPNFIREDKRPDDDDLAWHYGRVRFFYDRLIAGKKLNPVMIDNACYGSHISNEPVLTDGHHRLAAYWFAKSKTMPAYYSGRVDLLEYLTGQRRVRRPS